MRHVPNPVFAGITQSPFARPEDDGGDEAIVKTPSLPGRAEGSEVPMREVKLGFTPYVPWIVFTSAGLMGAARVRRRMEEEGREGEMECVCSLDTNC